MEPALFLDRDGVINVEKGRYVFSTEDFDLIPETLTALKQVSEKGYKIFVVTNQGGIAKGLYGHEDVLKVHDKMMDAFKSHDIEVACIYYCPHHSDISACLCRKPGSLLFEKIIARFHIDPEKSLMIGDRERDIIAAKESGINGVQIESNQNIETIISNWIHG